MKVLLVGYYGFNNLGDEWLLETLLLHLKKIDYQITVLSHHPRQTAAAYQVNACSRWNPVTIIKEIIKNDLLLFGGGGLIQDLSGFRAPGYYLGLCALGKLFGKKVIMIGQGFGPVSNKFNRLLCLLILPLVDMIVVRDKAGLMEFRNMDVEENKLIEAADLVWLKEFNIDVNAKKNKWLICLRADWLQNKIPDWLEAVNRSAQTLGKELGFIAIGNKGDAKLLHCIKNDQCFANCLFYEKQELPAAFIGAELVISMRYHGLLLGAVAEAMLIAVGRDQKLENLVASLHQKTATDKDIIDCIEIMMQQKNGFQQALIKAKADLIKKAKINIMALQTFLLQEYRKDV